MADKAISELVAAEQITATDMFVLEQNGTAKKLSGQVLLNWLTAAADGHGGIQSYTLLKTVGLVKTYRFTLADQTYMDIQVADGRGVSSIEKISTSGLKDTYRISYNDGSTGTFAITNGAKGDKGDNSYIWIKYASQQPTASSHSFGDVPDAWIGVYFGTLSSAPTDWQQYRWYQWKGAKGDKGDPATLVSAEVTYQAGTSGTVIPSGSWSSSIPMVSQGQYLWTRIVQQFNTGSPITAYSVSRMGLDGLGSVVSVAGVAPNSNGNVPLTAANIGALALAGGVMAGQLNMNGQKLTGLNPPTADDQPATKKYVDDIDWFNPGKSIPSNADLDTYTINGKYYCPNSATAKTLSNCPTTSNFVLFVFDRTTAGTVTHLIFSGTGRMYIRSKLSDSWNDWQKYALEDEITLAMNPGIEYETLEQYGGETVYVKRVTQEFTSTLGDKTTLTDISIPHGISKFKECIRWTGSDGSYTYPYFNTAGGYISLKSIDATNVNVRCYNAERPSPLTLSFIVYYTKNS